MLPQIEHFDVLLPINIPLYIDGHLGCLHIMPTVNDVVMNIKVYIFFLISGLLIFLL